MAILHTSFSRLTLSHAFIAYKNSYNRLSTTLPLSKVTIEEKLGIKPPPKRPKTSFLRFLSQIKPQIIQENPNMNIKDINRIAGERWRNIDETTKSKLSQEYKKEWNNYLDELKAYDKSLSSDQKQKIQKANETLFKKMRNKKLKEKMEELGRPKKPPATFVIFMQSKIHERGEKPFKEWLQSIKKEWENAPAEIKEKCQNIYNKEIEKYKLDIDKWEKKMKKEGHNELVRRSH